MVFLISSSCSSFLWHRHGVVTVFFVSAGSCRALQGSAGCLVLGKSEQSRRSRQPELDDPNSFSTLELACLHPLVAGACEGVNKLYSFRSTVSSDFTKPCVCSWSWTSARSCSLKIQQFLLMQSELLQCPGSQNCMCPQGGTVQNHFAHGRSRVPESSFQIDFNPFACFFQPAGPYFCEGINRLSCTKGAPALDFLSFQESGQTDAGSSKTWWRYWRCWSPQGLSTAAPAFHSFPSCGCCSSM